MVNERSLMNRHWSYALGAVQSRWIIVVERKSVARGQAESVWTEVGAW